MAKQIQLNTSTPLRLQAPICAAFIKQYRALIEANGATFALNFALAQTLKRQGHKLPDLETPGERIAKGQRRRWRAVKQANSAAVQANIETEQKAEARKKQKAAEAKATEAKTEDRRKKKALAEKARRQRIKLAKIQESENTA